MKEKMPEKSIDRRNFLKYTGAMGAALAMSKVPSFGIREAKAYDIKRLDSTGKVAGGNDFGRGLVSSPDAPGLARIRGAGINLPRVAVLVTAASKGGYATSHRFEMDKVRVDFLDTGKKTPRFPQHSYVMFVH